MIRNSLIVGTLLSIGVVVGARTSAAANPTPAVVWDVALGIARGTGCDDRTGDTSFIEAGNDMAVLFTSFGVNFQRNDSNPLTAKLSCLVRVPVTIRNGTYSSQLTQRITYGVNKSSGTSGAITVASSFLNLPVAPVNVTIPFGALNSPSLVSSSVTNFLVFTACSDDIRGLYSGRLGLSARRSSMNEDINLTTDGLDLRYDITMVLSPCPFP